MRLVIATDWAVLYLASDFVRRFIASGARKGWESLFPLMEKNYC